MAGFQFGNVCKIVCGTSVWLPVQPVAATISLHTIKPDQPGTNDVFNFCDFSCRKRRRGCRSRSISTSRETPNFEVEDAGKHAYYIRLTNDGSTITLTDSEYNAHVLTENKGGTLIDLGDQTVTLQVFRPALSKYDESNLFRNNPWYSTVVWEKRDALTGGLVDADTTFEIQEWNPEKGEYEKSTHYQVVRREDGKYTVHLIGDAFFDGWEGKQGVLYYHQANQGKYRIVELKAPTSYNLKAWEHNTWVIGWSEEIIVHPDYPTYEFLGETASRNMPYKTKVLIKKVDDATGEFILPDTTWTLYEWNERNNQYEVSTNYKTLTYAEVKALCAGNPLIKEKMDLDNEVARLSTLRSAHNAQIYELQDLVSIGYPAAIRRIGQELDALRQDAALFQSSLRKDDKGNEMFSAVIQGVTYTKRADADAALLEACKAAAAGAGEKKIGRYCGFDICVGYDPKIIGFAGYLQGKQRYRIELNPKQNFSSFRAVLENISAQIPVKIAAREEIEKNIESAKEAAKQPFAYEEEFQTKLARLNELNILLDQEKQELVQNEKENRMQKENVNLHAEENEDWEASTVEPAAKLPAGWKWTMYSDGSGRLEGPDKQSLYSYDCMTYASAGEIEYRKSNNSSWDVFPEGSLDRFREWAEQQLLQELKKEPLQYQEFLEHQSHQDDEIEKNPLDMEDAARQAGLTVQRDQDKPGAAYFDADQNVIHVSDAGSEEDVRLSELKGYADAVIQRTATVEQPVRDLESASLAVMLAARYDVGVSDRLSQQLASAHAEAVKCPTFDLPVTLQRLDKALDYCDHFLAHEQERALEQEAENEPEPEQVTELSPQSQAFMMDL